MKLTHKEKAKLYGMIASVKLELIHCEDKLKALEDYIVDSEE
jgi:hypothetical protein